MMPGPAATDRRLQVLSSHLTPSASEVADGLQRMGVSFDNSKSLWQDIPEGPPDAILGVTEAFKKDPSPKKINLGVGAYRTEEGKPLVLNVVRKAEQTIVTRPSENKEYLGITGNAQFNALSAKLAFGENSRVIAEGRNATVQALSGTGALRVGAEFLARHHAVHTVLLPAPTWANHHKIFPLGGIADVRTYRYFRPATRDLDFQGMIDDLRRAPEGAIVLLHACAHNPTGVDPSPAQWQAILQAVRQKRLLPFFDSAYQGFASGDLEGDAAALRLFADAGLEMLLAQSYAKNMGLYGERVGALSVVTKSADVTRRVESQLKQVIRPMFSSPPRHGAAIVVEILSNPQLYAEWREELAGMAGRIIRMRRELFQALQDVGAPGNWTPVMDAIGMFAMLGLTKAQVQHMTKKWHVYLTADSRISMAGLSSSTCRYLAEAINDAVRSA